MKTLSAVVAFVSWSWKWHSSPGTDPAGLRDHQAPFQQHKGHECETHRPQVSATTSLLSPPQPELLQVVQGGRAAAAPGRHSKDVLGFHLHITVGNGFCLLHERETPTNLKPEM